MVKLLVSVPSLKFEVVVDGEDPELVVKTAIHALLMFLDRIGELKKAEAGNG